MAEIQNEGTIDYAVEKVINIGIELDEDDKEAINTLISAFRGSEAELKDLIHKYQKQFNKREELEKELNSLSEGTDFMAVEKLADDLYQAEKCEYQRQEKITALSDELYRAKAEAQYQVDELIRPHRNDKETMKKSGYTKVDQWENHLRNEVLNEEIKEIEDGYKELAEKIETLKKESKEAGLDMKYLRNKLENRRVFAEINNRETVVVESKKAEAVKNSPEEKIKVI